MKDSSYSPIECFPNDWKITELKEVANIIMGQSPDSNFYNENEEGLPLIQGNADMKDRISIQRIYTSQLTKVCEKGDYILSVRAPVGSIGIASFNSCIGRGVCAIKPKNIESEYLFQLLINSEEKWKKIEQGSTFTAVSSKDVNNFKLLITTNTTEQKVIARILSLMDKAINKNNQLIAKKELQKKWLMQNLLTGKKRLKGFEEEWKEIHIRDVAEEVSLRNKEDKQLTVMSCTKYDGLVPSLEYFGRKIYSDDVSTYKVVPKNHFAYATNHIEEGSIGYQNIMDEALISPMYTVFKTDSSINDVFFYKLLKSYKLIYQYQNRMEGSIDRRGGLRWDAFSIIKVSVPSFKEQTAIAQFLQAAYKEIQLLNAKSEKLKEKKKWLMQVLLTGNIRVKV